MFNKCKRNSVNEADKKKVCINFSAAASQNIRCGCVQVGFSAEISILIRSRNSLSDSVFALNK